MSRYIEIEAALQIIDNYAKTVTADGKVVVDAVRDIVDIITPTADVVEVVRCKDCVYCRPYNDGKLYCHKKADIFVPIVDAHDYCSYGERKEE